MSNIAGSPLPRSALQGDAAGRPFCLGFSKNVRYLIEIRLRAKRG
jgi:hypothetical protein